MADEALDTMPLTTDQFAVLKMYCKIDSTVEDGMLMQLFHDASEQISSAIEFGTTPEQFLADPQKRDRFFSAAMKQTKEDYETRGLSADIMRYPVITSVDNTINQLRTELPLTEEASNEDE